MSMAKQAELLDEIGKLEEEVLGKKKKLAELKRELPREEVSDYTLQGSDGNPRKLSELFGDHNELIIIHNMGKGY